MELVKRYHLNEDDKLPDEAITTNAGGLLITCLNGLENNHNFCDSLINKFPSKDKVERYGGFVKFKNKNDMWTVRIVNLPSSYSLEITREDNKYPKFSDHAMLNFHYNSILSEKCHTRVEKARIFFATVLEIGNSFETNAWENNKLAVSGVQNLLKKL